MHNRDRPNSECFQAHYCSHNAPMQEWQCRLEEAKQCKRCTRKLVSLTSLCCPPNLTKRSGPANLACFLSVWKARSLVITPIYPVCPAFSVSILCFVYPRLGASIVVLESFVTVRAVATVHLFWGWCCYTLSWLDRVALL